MPDDAATYCGRCGRTRSPRAAMRHCARAARLEPPRYCPQCRRRMVVQVTPRAGRPAASSTATSTGTTGAMAAVTRRAEDCSPSTGTHLWHPYSSALMPSDPYLVESAAGVRLRLRDRRRAPRGHRRDVVVVVRDPRLRRARARRRGRAPARADEPRDVRRPDPRAGDRAGATAASSIAPDRLEHVFFADSGSVSVEVALKMALQCTRRRRPAAAADASPCAAATTATPSRAMSVCDPVNGMHTLFAGVLPEQVFAPRPPAGFDRPGRRSASWSAWERRRRSLYAAARRRGRGGRSSSRCCRAPAACTSTARACVRVLRELATSHGALLIFDEIATGFGRTGHAVRGSSTAGVVAGHHVRRQGADRRLPHAGRGRCAPPRSASGSPRGAAGALMHGPTFMANPLACAVALASLDLLQRQRLAQRTSPARGGLRDGPRAGRATSPASPTSGSSAASASSSSTSPSTSPRSPPPRSSAACGCGPFRDLVYTMPPYVTSPRRPRDGHLGDGRGGRARCTADEPLPGRPGSPAADRARGTRPDPRLRPRAHGRADGLLDLAGNDYLGLSPPPGVIAGAVAAAQASGAGAGASRLVTGTLGSTPSSSDALAELHGRPAALVFSTGYHANLGAVTALTDADT